MCGLCGTTAAQLHSWRINAEVVRVCDACAQQAEASLSDAQRKQQAKKSSFLGGLVGAFLGALLGAVAWVLISKLGYIAGFAGLLMGVCAMKGYELLGGHLDKKGVVCSVIIMAVMIYFANKIAWTWEMSAVLKGYGATFSDCYRSFFPILEKCEATSKFIADLAIGYVLTALASFVSIRNALRASNGSYVLRKLD